MSSPHRPRWLITLIIIVALPTIACFSYYSLNDQNNFGFNGGDSSFWATAVILAYPTALIGLIGLVMTPYSPQKATLKYWLWGL